MTKKTQYWVYVKDGAYTVMRVSRLGHIEVTAEDEDSWIPSWPGYHPDKDSEGLAKCAVVSYIRLRYPGVDV